MSDCSNHQFDKLCDAKKDKSDSQKEALPVEPPIKENKNENEKADKNTSGSSTCHATNLNKISQGLKDPKQICHFFTNNLGKSVETPIQRSA